MDCACWRAGICETQGHLGGSELHGAGAFDDSAVGTFSNSFCRMDEEIEFSGTPGALWSSAEQTGRNGLTLSRVQPSVGDGSRGRNRDPAGLDLLRFEQVWNGLRTDSMLYRRVAGRSSLREQDGFERVAEDGFRAVQNLRESVNPKPRRGYLWWFRPVQKSKPCRTWGH